MPYVHVNTGHSYCLVPVPSAQDIRSAVLYLGRQSPEQHPVLGVLSACESLDRALMGARESRRTADGIAAR